MSDILSDCVESENFRGLDLFLYWWEQQVEDITEDITEKTVKKYNESITKVKKNNEALIRFDPTNETIKTEKIFQSLREKSI